MTSNARKIADWRLANPDKQLTVPLLLEILGLKTLSSSDLSGADLSGSNLRGACLRWARLYGANLRGAGLSGSNLRGAGLSRSDLSGSNLHGTDLYGARLYGANLTGASVIRANLSGANLSGADLPGYMPLRTPSGEGDIRATPDGWRVNIGCWQDKTLSDLKALITDEAEWPEVKGNLREKRRPFLVAIAALMEAQAAYYPDLIDDLAEKWKTES